jgi:tetratricopeptide (TPR) repeat protein
MAIKGSFKEVSLPDVLQLLAVGRKTGCLKVTDGSNFGNVYFQDGKISFANLLNRQDRLGDRLFSRGLITEQNLQDALSLQQQEGGARRLGSILMDMGLIKQSDIEADVSGQIEDTIFYLLRWPDGEFFFEPDSLPEGETILVSLDAMNLLLEEARRVDEWRTLEKKLPSPQTVLERVMMDLEKQEDLNLNSEEKQILSLIDGYHSLAEIIETSALGEFSTAKIIYGLLLAGLAKRGSEKSKQAASWNVNIIDDHRNLGMAFYRTQMLDEALREYRRIIEIKPDHYEARFYLGLIHFRKGEYAESATEFLEAIAVEPKKAAAYNNLGMSLEQMGEKDDAVRQYRKAIELSPEFALPRVNLAFLLYGGDDIDAAREQINRIDNSSTQPAIMAFVSGLISLKNNDAETALKLWAGIDNSQKNNPALQNNIGAVMQAKGQEEEAERYYNAALKADPNDRVALRNLLELYYRNGMASQSIEILNRMAEMGLLTPSDMARLGNLYLKQGQKEQAIKWWKKTLETDPENQMVKRNLSLMDKNAFAK